MDKEEYILNLKNLEEAVYMLCYATLCRRSLEISRGDNCFFRKKNKHI